MTERKILSDREYEVLHLVAHGLSAAETGERLGISETTVKTHLAHVFGKLKVHDRAAAVHQAHRLGILT
jgi:ATP/maltotriose-dependent transcriptional regulator MalT